MDGSRDINGSGVGLLLFCVVGAFLFLAFFKRKESKRSVWENTGFNPFLVTRRDNGARRRASPPP